LALIRQNLFSKFTPSTMAGKTVLRRKLRRVELIPFFEKLDACTVILEACGAGHHWSRVLTGHIVDHARHDEAARRLATIPGIGPITSSLVAATVTDFGVFKRARDFTA
jgi:transposase